MAKTEPASIRLGELDANERRQLAALKRPVIDAARQYGAIREKLADLAPRVIKLFAQLAAKIDNFTFVEYCRMFDPTVPLHAGDRDGAEGYRNHRTYYTLAYMRRLVQATGGRRKGQQGVRDSAVDGLARTLATILQIVTEEQREQVWNTVQTEFSLPERTLTRLRKRVDATKPLFTLDIAGKTAKVGKVIHMERITPSAEPLAQPGQNVSLPERGRKRAA